MGLLVPVKTEVVHLDALPVHVPAMVFPEVLDAVIPGLYICAARKFGIKLLERDLARLGDDIVDRQFQKPQVFRRKVISIAGPLKNINRLFRSSSF